MRWRNGLRKQPGRPRWWLSRRCCESSLTPVPHEFHFRGDSQALLTQVAAAFGISAEFDESFPSRRVHFDLDSIDFYTAMRAACDVTGDFLGAAVGKTDPRGARHRRESSSIRPHGDAHLLLAWSHHAARSE